MEERLLSIIIPTYNRGAVLEESLKQLKELSKSFSFDLIVCNNASTDQTTEILQNWEPHFPHLKIITHQENVYYDRNVASGYLEVSTEYCWLLGDSYAIGRSDFNEILATLREKQPMALVINDSLNSLSSPSKVYTDANQLLKELGWYTTMLSSCIIRKDFISVERCERYYDSGFIHEGLFFDYLASVDAIHVLTLPSVHLSHLTFGNAGKSKAATGWMRTPFIVFGKRWFSFVMSLPYQYSIENKFDCIRQHNRHQNVFSPWVLFKNKLSGYTTFSDYQESRPFLRYIYDYPLIITDIIRVIPSMPLLFSLVKKCIK